MRPQTIDPVSGDTARVVRAAFPRGNASLALRDGLGTIIRENDFAVFLSTRGRPAEIPWRLALVAAPQFTEGLFDRRVNDTDARNRARFEEVGLGTVRVVRGSASKTGIGTNVQERLVARSHLDAPWRPGEVERLYGVTTGADGRARAGVPNPRRRFCRVASRGGC